jgi:hypothetical protein
MVLIRELNLVTSGRHVYKASVLQVSAPYTTSDHKPHAGFRHQKVAEATNRFLPFTEAMN